MRMDWRCGKSDDPRIRRQPWYGATSRRSIRRTNYPKRGPTPAGPGVLARADAGPAPGRGEERPAATIDGFPYASQIDSPALEVRYLLGIVGVRPSVSR